MKPPPRAQRRMQQKIKQHDRAFKEVTKRKNVAKQALRSVKKKGCRSREGSGLAGEFLSLLRDHSRLKKALIAPQEASEAKVHVAGEQCHKYFWLYRCSVTPGIGFDEDCTSQTFPQFSSICPCLLF